MLTDDHTWEVPVAAEEPVSRWLVAGVHLVLMALALELGALAYLAARVLGRCG